MHLDRGRVLPDRRRTASNLPRRIVEVTGSRVTRAASCTRSAHCSCSSRPCSGPRTCRCSAGSCVGGRSCTSAIVSYGVIPLAQQLPRAGARVAGLPRVQRQLHPAAHGDVLVERRGRERELLLRRTADPEVAGPSAVPEAPAEGGRVAVTDTTLVVGASGVRDPATTFPCFDGLRAIAACAVVLHHVSFPTGRCSRGFAGYFSPPRHRCRGVLPHLRLPALPAVRRRAARRAPGAVGAPVLHVAGCCASIPPTGSRSIGIIVFFGLQVPVGGIRSYIEYFTLFQIYDDIGRATGGISQAWTLSVELSFYAFLPLYSWVMRPGERRAQGRSTRALRARGPRRLYAVSVVFSGARVHARLRPGAHPRYLLVAGQPRLLRARYGPRGRQRVDRAARHGSEVARSRRPHVALCWLLSLLCFVAVSKWIRLPVGLERVDGMKGFARQFLYGVSAFFLLLPAVFGPQQRGLDPAVPALAPVVYPGSSRTASTCGTRRGSDKVVGWTGPTRVPHELPGRAHATALRGRSSPRRRAGSTRAATAAGRATAAAATPACRPRTRSRHERRRGHADGQANAVPVLRRAAARSPRAAIVVFHVASTSGATTRGGARPLPRARSTSASRCSSSSRGSCSIARSWSRTSAVVPRCGGGEFWWRRVLAHLSGLLGGAHGRDRRLPQHRAPRLRRLRAALRCWCRSTDRATGSTGSCRRGRSPSR